MSPDFFNLYNKFILKELKERIQINGPYINSIPYANDTVSLHLQRLVCTYS